MCIHVHYLHVHTYNLVYFLNNLMSIISIQNGMYHYPRLIDQTKASLVLM